MSLCSKNVCFFASSECLMNLTFLMILWLECVAQENMSAVDSFVVEASEQDQGDDVCAVLGIHGRGR